MFLGFRWNKDLRIVCVLGVVFFVAGCLWAWQRWSYRLEVFFAQRLEKRINRALTPPETARQLYWLMHEVCTLLESAGITYWLEGGSLLGAVRNGGLIPTDDDLDLCVFVEDSPRIQALAAQLKAKGLRMLVVDEGHLLQIHTTQAPFVWLDILLVQRWCKNPDGCLMRRGQATDEGQKIVTYAAVSHRKDFPNFFHEAADLFPLKKMAFGPLHVWSPQNPHPYLDRGYPGWRSIALVRKHRGSQKGFVKFRVPLSLSLSLRSPARL